VRSLAFWLVMLLGYLSALALVIERLTKGPIR
jgi:hypothetical protein